MIQNILLSGLGFLLGSTILVAAGNEVESEEVEPITIYQVGETLPTTGERVLGLGNRYGDTQIYMVLDENGVVQQRLLDVRRSCVCDEMTRQENALLIRVESGVNPGGNRSYRIEGGVLRQVGHRKIQQERRQ